MNRILILGGKGQLGRCLEKIAGDFPELDLILCGSEVNICSEQSLIGAFDRFIPHAVINCAAYTAVDQAEEEREIADAINGAGPGKLARICQQRGVRLVHISTDFVFQGQSCRPLTEQDPAVSEAAYGASKRAGELAVMEGMQQYIIIRTSWLYSEFGNNFVKTMLRLGKSKPELRVVADQIGSPTYAVDLARVILQVLSRSDFIPGIYHYSNEGVASWYDFAFVLFRKAGLTVPVYPISTQEYPTKAERPAYSVMSKQKIKEIFDLRIPHWQDSLEDCLREIQQDEQKIKKSI